MSKEDNMNFKINGRKAIFTAIRIVGSLVVGRLGSLVVEVDSSNIVWC